jgi:hypothetical protein
MQRTVLKIIFHARTTKDNSTDSHIHHIYILPGSAKPVLTPALAFILDIWRRHICPSHSFKINTTVSLDTYLFRWDCANTPCLVFILFVVLYVLDLPNLSCWRNVYADDGVQFRFNDPPYARTKIHFATVHKVKDNELRNKTTCDEFDCSLWTFSVRN